jgi:peptidoglycan lytic transglycosylase
VIRRTNLRLATLPVMAALALPPLALAASGGSGVAVPGPPAATAAHIASVSGNGITLTGRDATMVGGWLPLSGTVSPAAKGATVELQQQRGSTWMTVASAITSSGGSFHVTWHPHLWGRTVALRATIGSGSRLSPSLTVTVYRASIATLFGPTLWGRHTACGEKLTHTTLGVANRTLPCGTPVTLYYHGRTLVVPVIDRGPYANHANWDLTMATGAALGMNETATIGALAQRTTG